MSVFPDRIVLANPPPTRQTVIIQATNSKYREKETVYLHPELATEINLKLKELPPGEFLFPLLLNERLRK